MTLATLTLGCKVNTYDTEAIEQTFIQKGFTLVDFSEKADVYLINTCTVTNLGDKKSRQMIRKAKKINPNAIVVATGCYAQVSPLEVEKIEGVNLVLGTKNRSKIFEQVNFYINSKSKEVFNNVSDIFSEFEFENLKINGLKDRTRAYLKIQDGCDRFCTYCIIPYARGPVRSRKKDDILTEVLSLAANGYKEIVLSGIHVASYGKDLKDTNLIEIIKDVNNVKGIERIRFSSIDPSIITEDFVNNIKAFEKVCHHMHLSLQSGSNSVLKRMNRRYSIEQYSRSLELLRDNFSDMNITTDIIVGFPGETIEEFQQSYSFCKESLLGKIHVFPYSPKKGTKASKMENQVSANEKDKRSQKFLNLDLDLQKQFFNKNLNKIMPVLFEKNIGENFYEGYTSNYVKVVAYSNNNISNNILNVSLENIVENHIFGTIL